METLLNRKLLAPLVCAALILCAGRSSAAVLGDVTGDGRADVSDAVRMLRIAIGLELPTDRIMILGDVYPHPGVNGAHSGDQKINVQDVTFLLRRIAGLISDSDFGVTETYVAIKPLYTILPPGAQVRFTALPINMNTPITWTLLGDASTAGVMGTLDQTGLYTAPSSVNGVISITVQASSNGQVASAEVDIVNSGPPPPPPG
jgi:hypothetical protein